MVGSVASRLAFAAIQGSLYFCLVWVICSLFRRLPAVWKCWLWRLVSLKFLLGLVIAISLPVVMQPAGVQSNTVSRVTHAVAYALPRANASVQAISHPASSPESTRDTAVHVQPLAILLAIWLIGVIAVLIRGIASWRGVQRIVRQSDDWALLTSAAGAQETLIRCGQKVPLRVRSFKDLASPALIGLFKPTILLPSDLLNTSPGALCSAIAHEIAHLRRRDVGWVLVAEAAKTIFWFHPFAWVACREQRVEAEIAADQLARNWTEVSPKAYAGHLLEWIDPRRDACIAVQAVPGLLLSTHQMVRRVKAMSIPRYPGRVALAFAAVLAVPSVLGIAPIDLTGIGGNGLADSVWPKFHGSNAQSTGRAGGAGAVGVLRWSFQTISGIESSPVFGPDGSHYFGSGDSRVYCLDAADGRKKWDVKTAGVVNSSPAIGSDGTVYVASEDGRCYALDGSTGAEKWSFETNGLTYASPAIGLDDTVYVSSWDGFVYALDGATGAQKWSFKTSGPVTSSAAIGADGSLYTSGRSGKSLYALDGATGHEKWSFQAGDTVQFAVNWP